MECTWKAVTAPASEDAEYHAGLRTAITAAVGYVLDGLEDGLERSGAVPGAVIEQAHRAARLRIRLDTIVGHCITGHTMVADFVIQETDHFELSAHRAALRKLLGTQAALLDDLVARITDAYLSETERAERSPEQRRTERVRRLLAGESGDTTGLAYNLDAWHLGGIATGARGREAVNSLAERLGRQLLPVQCTENTVWAWFGGPRTAISAEIDRLVCASNFPDVRIALGEPAHGLEGWRLTHRQAQAALVVALRSPQPLTRFADVALLALALRERTLARSLIEIYLSPLDDRRDGGVDARQTLRAYFAAGGVVATAAVALGVDRHTVVNRLRTIERKLERLLPSCRAELEIALRLEELDSDPLVKA